jgi:hypothetical protein
MPPVWLRLETKHKVISILVHMLRLVVQAIVPAFLLLWFAVVALAGRGLNDPGTFNLLKERKRTAGGVHVPIYRKQTSRLLRKRGVSSSAIGLGDVQDM